MENKTKTQLEAIKKELANLISNESDKALVDKVAGLSSQVDNAIKESEKANEQYSEMKNDYIELVKNTKFKNTSDDMGESHQQEATLENIVANIIKERKK